MWENAATQRGTYVHEDNRGAEEQRIYVAPIAPSPPPPAPAVPPGVFRHRPVTVLRCRDGGGEGKGTILWAPRGRRRASHHDGDGRQTRVPRRGCALNPRRVYRAAWYGGSVLRGRPCRRRRRVGLSAREGKERGTAVPRRSQRPYPGATSGRRIECSLCRDVVASLHLQQVPQRDLLLSVDDELRVLVRTDLLLARPLLHRQPEQTRELVGLADLLPFHERVERQLRPV